MTSHSGLRLLYIIGQIPPRITVSVKLYPHLVRSEPTKKSKMKLFVFAAIIAVSAAARLEHLEQQQQQQQQLRAYLPPFGSFGPKPGAFGAAPAGQPSFNARGSFPNAFRQYLPPDQVVDTPAGSPQSPGAVNGFGAQNGANQQYGQQDAQGFNSFGPQGNFQPQPSANQQYIAPHSSQNIPQQPFDEQTGYHY